MMFVSRTNRRNNTLHDRPLLHHLFLTRCPFFALREQLTRIQWVSAACFSNSQWSHDTFIPQSLFKASCLKIVNSGAILYNLQPINFCILCNWKSWFVFVQMGYCTDTMSDNASNASGVFLFALLSALHMGLVSIPCWGSRRERFPSLQILSNEGIEAHC